MCLPSRWSRCPDEQHAARRAARAPLAQIACGSSAVAVRSSTAANARLLCVNDDDAAQRRKVVLDGLREVERRFREERARHSAAIAPIREELWRLVEQGDTLGLSITSMAKEIKVSRGRLKRMIQRLGSPSRGG
jgi:hypothetical protein